MAESFSNSLIRAVGIVSTSSSGSIGVYANHISGISTTNVSVGDLVDNAHYIAGTKVTGLLLDIAKTELERLVNEYEKCVQQESSFMIKKNN